MADVSGEQLFNGTNAAIDCLVDAGFISDRLVTSTAYPVTIAIAILLLLLAIFTTLLGARSLTAGPGAPRRTELSSNSTPRFQGGVGGFMSTSLAIGTTGGITMEMIVSNQSPPSLGTVGVIAILVAPALAIGILGARYRWVGKASFGLLAA